MLLVVFLISLLFVGIYFVAKEWPSPLSFGQSEGIFIVVLVVALFIGIKFVKTVRQERRAKKNISEALRDPKLLLEKLNHPEVVVGGKTQRIEKVFEYGEGGEKIGLNFEADGEGIKANQEKIRPKIEPRPKKKKVGVKKPAPKKKGKKK